MSPAPPKDCAGSMSFAEEVESAFAEQEGSAFVGGDGVDKPKGFLAYPTVADASWSWGNIGTLKTGVAGAFAASNPSDILVDLVYALKAGYRQNASFVMNRKTQAVVRKFKDTTGKYHSKTHFSEGEIQGQKRMEPPRRKALWWKRLVEIAGVVSAIVGVVRLVRGG